MHELRAYTDPEAGFSQRLRDFIEKGVWWSSTEELQASMTLEEKGWRVNVHWEEEFRNGKSIGLGVFADQDIPKGTVMRDYIIGQTILLFTKSVNFPVASDLATLDYLQHHACKCPCLKDQHEILMVNVPGSSFNHGLNPNIRPVCTKSAIQGVAIRDIKKGEALQNNYHNNGEAPEWFTEILSANLGNKECTFDGSFNY